MAPSLMACSVVAAPASLASSVAAAASAESARVRAFQGLKVDRVFSGKSALLSSKTVSNGSRVSCMQVLDPFTNLKYETLSYLPPLKPEQVLKQIEFILRNGWIPCLEFCDKGTVYKEHFRGSGYYDGRYWTMWKLPMFGCNDAAAVSREIEECKKAYPTCFVRVLGFDRDRQVQIVGFLVWKPK